MGFVRQGAGYARQTLIIGSGNELNTAYLALSKNKRNSVNTVCVNGVADDETLGFINSADQVYICPSLNCSLKKQIINKCIEAGKAAYVIPGIYEISMAKAKVKTVDDLLVLKMGDVCIPRKKEIVKRIFDIAVAVIGIVVTIPLMLFIAAVIKLYDGGPIFFRQERLTKEGKLFILYKFRTMIADAEKHTGPVLASENDNRITPAGRKLRATRADELPQLFNVIKGDMSMVGPRPERPQFALEFSEAMPEFKYRLAVKAGITGLAQVFGRYTTAPENKLKFDLLYIKNYSVWLDINILLRTAGVIFKRDYSAGVAISAGTDNSSVKLEGSTHTQ